MTVGGFADRGGRSQTIHFLRHLLEMVLAMMVGMFVGAAVFVSALRITVEEAIQDHSVSFVIVIAFSMTVPMVAWMSYRGHPRDRSLVMGAPRRPTPAAPRTGAEFAPGISVVVALAVGRPEARRRPAGAR